MASAHGDADAVAMLTPVSQLAGPGETRSLGQIQGIRHDLDQMYLIYENPYESFLRTIKGL